MRSNTGAPSAPRLFMSARNGTAPPGYSPSAITALGSNPNTRSRFLDYSHGSTLAKNTPAPVLVWQSASESWNATTVESGSKRSPEKDLPSASPSPYDADGARKRRHI